jgi:hypothetical protein
VRDAPTTPRQRAPFGRFRIPPPRCQLCGVDWTTRRSDWAYGGTGELRESCALAVQSRAGACRYAARRSYPAADAGGTGASR